MVIIYITNNLIFIINYKIRERTQKYQSFYNKNIDYKDTKMNNNIELKVPNSDYEE